MKRKFQARIKREKISLKLFEETLKNSKIKEINKEKAKAVLVDGLTLRETSEKLGGTYQNVSLIVGKVEKIIKNLNKKTSVQLGKIK